MYECKYSYSNVNLLLINKCIIDIRLFIYTFMYDS
jgi:hypothetical protein